MSHAGAEMAETARAFRAFTAWHDRMDSHTHSRCQVPHLRSTPHHDACCLVTEHARQPDAEWIAPVTTNSLNSISLGNQFVAVGDNGTIVTSTNGVAWQVVPSGTTRNLNTVLFALIGFVAAGAGGVNLTSF